MNTSRNILIISLILILCAYNINAQALGQDSKGFSSILLPSANLNIDGSNNVITISFAQLHKIEKKDDSLEKISYIKCFIDKQSSQKMEDCIHDKWNLIEQKYKESGRALLYGLELKGSSKNGLSFLFENELLANNASVNGIFGIHLRNKKYNRKSLSEYVKVKMRDFTLYEKYEKFIDSIEFQVNIMTTKGLITIQKGEKILNFLNLRNNSEKLHEIQARLNDLSNPKASSNIDNRLDEIYFKIDVLDQIHVLINSVINNFPSKTIIFDLANPSDSLLTSLYNKKTSVDSLLYILFSQSGYLLKSKKINLEKYLEKDTWEDAEKEIKSKITYLKSTEIRLREIKENIEAKNTYCDSFKKLSSLLLSLSNTIIKIEKNSERLSDIERMQTNYNKHFLYGKAGFSGKSFLYALDNGAAVQDKRIEEKRFYGSRIEVGWTHQLKKFNFFGVNIALDNTDNSDFLDSRTYEFKILDNTTNTPVESSNKIEALYGTYDRLHQYKISGDYVRLIPLKNKRSEFPKVYLNVNLYFRHYFYNKSETLIPNTTFGIGMYAFNIKKNSIAGGLFVQADDVFTNMHENPIHFTNQISVGLIFKYALFAFDLED